MLIQTYGKKKNAIALAILRLGMKKITINGVPFNLIKPNVIKDKILEPFFLLDNNSLLGLRFSVYTKGGGSTSQVYAIRQAIAKTLLIYRNTMVSKNSSNFLKIKMFKFDKRLLLSDTRKKEPKKFGGKGARSRFQKSYR